VLDATSYPSSVLRNSFDYAGWWYYENGVSITSSGGWGSQKIHLSGGGTDYLSNYGNTHQ
jgi:hypothetical protein